MCVEHVNGCAQLTSPRITIRRPSTAHTLTLMAKRAAIPVCTPMIKDAGCAGIAFPSVKAIVESATIAYMFRVTRKKIEINLIFALVYAVN